MTKQAVIIKKKKESQRSKMEKFGRESGSSRRMLRTCDRIESGHEMSGGNGTWVGYGSAT